MKRYRIRNVKIAPRSKHLAKRRKKAKALCKNIFRLLLIIIIVFSLGFLGAWFYGFLHSAKGFNIEGIDIQGTAQLKEKEVLELLSVKLPQNIFTIDLREARERIESHPRIKEAIIHRRPPDRVVIRIKEREPIAILNCEGTFLGIDASYVPFFLIEPLKEIDLPLITGIGSSKIVIGQKSGSPTLRIAIDILKTVLSLGGPLFNQISEINMKEGINLYTIEEATRVCLGGEDFRSQLLNLQGVLIHLSNEKRRAKCIDLRFRNKVVVKLEEG